MTMMIGVVVKALKIMMIAMISTTRIIVVEMTMTMMEIDDDDDDQDIGT